MCCGEYQNVSVEIATFGTYPVAAVDGWPLHGSVHECLILQGTSTLESPIVDAPKYGQSLYKGHSLRSLNIFSLQFQYILDFPIKDTLLTKDKITVPKCSLFRDFTVYDYSSNMQPPLSTVRHHFTELEITCIDCIHLYSIYRAVFYCPHGVFTVYKESMFFMLCISTKTIWSSL